MIDSYEILFLRRVFRYIRDNEQEVDSYPTSIRDWIRYIFKASQAGLLELRMSCENPITEPATMCEAANIVSDMIYQYHEDEDFMSCPIFRKLVALSTLRDMHWKPI